MIIHIVISIIYDIIPYMTINWTKIYKNYKGLWVALADDEITVLGSGKTLKEALFDAKKNGTTDPIVMRVPKKVITYVGSL